MEEAGLIHPAFGHQEMEVGVEVDPVAEGLDGSNEPRLNPGSRDHLKIAGQGAEG